MKGAKRKIYGEVVCTIKFLKPHKVLTRRTVLLQRLIYPKTLTNHIDNVSLGEQLSVGFKLVVASPGKIMLPLSPPAFLESAFAG